MGKHPFPLLEYEHHIRQFPDRQFRRIFAKRCTDRPGVRITIRASAQGEMGGYAPWWEYSPDVYKKWGWAIPAQK